jgi:putative ABC transport system permease protein
MNFIKRATTSIKRGIGKTLLLFLLITVLGSVISGAISANQATETTERHLRNSMLPVALIEGNWEAIRELEDEGERVSWVLPPETIRQVGALPYVGNFDYSAEGGLFGVGLEPYEPETEDGMGGGFWSDPNFGTQFMIRGVQDPNVFDIQEGLIELVDGRVFTSTEIENLTNVVMISQNFAQQNNLHVGSTLSLRNVVIDWWGDAVPLGDAGVEIVEVSAETEVVDETLGTGESIVADETYDMEIIGIFRPNINPDTGDQWNDMHILREFENRIYTSNTFVEMTNRFQMEALRELHPDDFEEMFGEDITWYRNIFVLNDPGDLGAFQEAATQIIPGHFMVVVAENDFQDVEAALISIGQLTFRILLVSAGAAILILTLLIMLFLRDRQREIGIYLALGEKRSKITSQIILEIMLVSFVAIIAALFIGNIIAGNMSETMLLNDIAARQETTNGWGGMMRWDQFAALGFSTDVPVEEIIASYNVSLTPTTILMFLGVGLGTTLLATVVPIIYITRLNPKKIMM